MKLVVTKLLATSALMSVMTTAALAADQKIDLSAMTCRDFIASDQAKSTLILAWFLGFYGEEEDPQVIDLGKLEAARGQFADFCKQQPNFRMTVAAEGILETPEQGNRPPRTAVSLGLGLRRSIACICDLNRRGMDHCGRFCGGQRQPQC